MKLRGDYKLVCDVCGRVCMRSIAKKRWDGLMVCPEDFEPRHINDSLPPFYKNEGRGVKDARPEVTETFVSDSVTAQSDNYNKGKIWGDTGNAIWGGAGDPSIWGSD